VILAIGTGVQESRYALQILHVPVVSALSPVRSERTVFEKSFEKSGNKPVSG